MMKYRLAFGMLLTFFMVILSACGGSNTPSGSQEAQVSLSDFAIAAPMTTFSPDVPYHFVVTNNGKVAHEFMIMPMGMNMSGMSMEDMHKNALAMIDTVAPGETKTVDFTFPSSRAGQNLEFSCHLPGHYEAGMRLPITVNK